MRSKLYNFCLPNELLVQSAGVAQSVERVALKTVQPQGCGFESRLRLNSDETSATAFAFYFLNLSTTSEFVGMIQSVSNLAKNLCAGSG